MELLFLTRANALKSLVVASAMTFVLASCQTGVDSVIPAAEGVAGGSAKGGGSVASVSDFKQLRAEAEQIVTMLAKDKTWLTRSTLEQLRQSRLPVSQVQRSLRGLFSFNNQVVEAKVSFGNKFNKAAALSANIDGTPFGVILDPDRFFVRNDDNAAEYVIPVAMSNGETKTLRLPKLVKSAEERKQIIDAIEYPIFVVDVVHVPSKTARDAKQSGTTKAGAVGVVIKEVDLATKWDWFEEEFEVYVATAGKQFPANTYHTFDGVYGNDYLGRWRQYVDVNYTGTHSMDVAVHQFAFAGQIVSITPIEDDVVAGSYQMQNTAFDDPSGNFQVKLQSYNPFTNLVNTSDSNVWKFAKANPFVMFDDDDLYLSATVENLSENSMSLRIGPGSGRTTFSTKEAVGTKLVDVNYILGLQ